MNSQRAWDTCDSQTQSVLGLLMESAGEMTDTRLTFRAQTMRTTRVFVFEVLLAPPTGHNNTFRFPGEEADCLNQAVKATYRSSREKWIPSGLAYLSKS
jgi:hypothetical protein